MVSTYASFSSQEIAAARVSPSQTLFFQLYKHRVDEIAEKRVKEVEALGYKAIFLTVDAVIPGNRERDIRASFYLEDQEREIEFDAIEEQRTNKDSCGKSAVTTESGSPQQGTSAAFLANVDRDLTWEKASHLIAHILRS